MTTVESPDRLSKNRRNAIGAFAVCGIFSLLALWLVVTDVIFLMPLPEREEMTVVESQVRSFKCQKDTMRSIGGLTLYLRDMPKSGIPVSKFGISCALWKNHPPEHVRYLAYENGPGGYQLYHPWELEINGTVYITFQEARSDEFTGVMGRAGLLIASTAFTIWVVFYSGIGVLKAKRCHVALIRCHPDLRTVRLTRLIKEYSDCDQLGQAHDFVQHFVNGSPVSVPFRSTEQAEAFATKLSDEHVEVEIDRRMVWRPMDWWNKPGPLYQRDLLSQ